MLAPEHELNPTQRAAVLHQEGPLLILAGAGSGKTRVIAYRLAELLHRGVDPERLLAVTFTNKAAAELRSRVEDLAERFGLLPSPQPGQLFAPSLPRWIGTFHAIAARLLRRMADRAGLPSDFVILDEADQLKICKEILASEKIDETHLTARALRSALDRAKNKGLLPGQLVGHDYLSDLVARLYPLYQAQLLRLGAVDFGDLLLWPVVLCDRDPALADLLGRRFLHVLVDEFQDVNDVQYRLLRHLAAGHRNLVVVGDDDQAIYGWRGADVRIILGFERDFPDVQIVKLEENYRSSQVILDAAHAVVSRNAARRDKRLYTQKQGGERIIVHESLDERREALYVASLIGQLTQEQGYSPADCAVIYRTNAQSRVLEEALRACDLQYTIYGGARFYDRAEVKDVLAYLRVCQNPADELALGRIINVPARGIGDKTIAKLTARARLGGVTLWQAILDARQDAELLGAAPRKKLSLFVTLIEGLRAQVGFLPVSRLAKEALLQSGYLASLDDRDPEQLERRQNVLELLGSIEELERETAAQVVALGQQEPTTIHIVVNEPDAVAQAYEAVACDDAEPDDLRLAETLFAAEPVRPLNLADYLARIALVTGDERGEGRAGVQLMTAHAAKGLEFPVVLVTGLEDGLFPSIRPGQHDGDELDLRLEEERRLCYVAMTRAKERLFLSHAKMRRIFGMQPRLFPPSRFLHDIPAECFARTREYEAPSQLTPRRMLALAQPAWSRGGRATDARTPLSLADEVQALEERASSSRTLSPVRAEPDIETSSEPRVEYDHAVEGPLRIGQRVSHQTLGRGRIERLMQISGSAAVLFQSGERRTVQVRYLRAEWETD